MPRTLSPIPLQAAIVDRAGAINDFFRLRWQELIDGSLFTPSVASVSSGTPAPSASLATTAVYTTKTSGRYRVSYGLHKKTPDGVSSSLTVTIGWVQGGIALTKTFAALTLDTVLAEQDGVIPFRADANIDITIAILYASNTPGLMAYEYDVTVENLA